MPLSDMVFEALTRFTRVSSGLVLFVVWAFVLRGALSLQLARPLPRPLPRGSF